ncbi:uclacyanin-3 [Rhodamnia argentea]|uniref:Uclacyanin-3 n=1 Tax=Rhodamnia argentea TaxID=178133 RepID=A0A8B8MUR5_9MYRT|nr:uclacyanin-3 [Rhodamnia argentea]
MATASLTAPALLILLLAIPAEVHGATHTVGDSSGWTQSYDYGTWAASQTFNVGDTLVFSYALTHSVDQVSKDDYDNCNVGSALKSFTGGSSTITLSSAGPMYFICPTLGHCSGGMRLAITVGSSSTTPSSPLSPPSTGTPTGSPPSTPTGTTAPPPPKANGAAGAFGMSHVMIGVSSVVVTAIALVC